MNIAKRYRWHSSMLANSTRQRPLIFTAPQMFFYQLERDALKKFLCEKYGIKLVPIPSRFTFKDPANMKAFVCDRIKDLPQE
ncbi:hypothetical protein JG688_00018437 [Phytophthora aleatoria]|uniref:Uncharacterized protein n=1 Tax=Phytophthora aleatoria TaxID=2496075 RepID=A0A8J5LUQ4_9STRA|nr:hypothetical protein JG688_00018437 [Phytophthora aleatoria]